MVSEDVDRLHRILGAAELRRLLDRLVHRLELDQPLDGVVTLEQATSDERRAVERLLGRRPGRGSSLSVSLPALEAVLRRAGLAPDLRAAIEAVVGPVRGRTERMAADTAAREAARAGAARGRHAGQAWYEAWLDEVSADGTLTRLLRRGEPDLLARVASVLDQLDAVPSGIVPLPSLAERATGDTKALSGTPLAALVLRALAAREDVPAPATRADERALWETAGVIVDDLTSQVLVLNLRASGSRLASWLADAAQLGVPFRITLHQLVTMPLALDRGDVFVCENPAVLRAAAAEWGTACAPLVCTEGVPSLACHRLLADAADGVRIRWRGDLDWTGLRLTATAIERYCATPWRMGLADYEAALHAGDSVALRGHPAASPWEEALASRMSETGRAVMEERLLPLLLADLRAGTRRGT